MQLLCYDSKLFLRNISYSVNVMRAAVSIHLAVFVSCRVNIDIKSELVVNNLNLRFNESCDSLDNARACEDSCTRQFQECNLNCEDQGKCCAGIKLTVSSLNSQ